MTIAVAMVALFALLGGGAAFGAWWRSRSYAPEKTKLEAEAESARSDAEIAKATSEIANDAIGRAGKSLAITTEVLNVSSTASAADLGRIRAVDDWVRSHSGGESKSSGVDKPSSLRDK